MTRILLLGEDVIILSDRARLLERNGAIVSYCIGSEFNPLAYSVPFDLVILCHTIDRKVQASMLIAEIYRHWPQAPVLRIVKGAGPQAEETGVDTALVFGEHGELVHMAERLLGRSPEQEWHPLSQHTPSIQQAA